MSIPNEIISRLSLSVQPLVFETPHPEYPYSTAGTVFLVGYTGKPYVLTSRHSLITEELSPICIFPSDSSQRTFPLKTVFFVPHNDEPEDFMDLAAIEIDPKCITEPELSHATLIDLEKACDSNWHERANQMAFFTIGYPSERSYVDYDVQELRTDRITLIGKYRGHSSWPFLHIMEIENASELQSFSGFSGAPVFALSTMQGEMHKPILCGMALRGTPNSGVIYFLAASVLLDALNVMNR